MTRRKPPRRAAFEVFCPNCGEGGRVFEGTFRQGYSESEDHGTCKLCHECGHVWDVTCQHCEDSQEPPQQEGA